MRIFYPQADKRTIFSPGTKTYRNRQEVIRQMKGDSVAIWSKQK